MGARAVGNNSARRSCSIVKERETERRSKGEGEFKGTQQRVNTWRKGKMKSSLPEPFGNRGARVRCERTVKDKNVKNPKKRKASLAVFGVNVTNWKRHLSKKQVEPP